MAELRPIGRRDASTTTVAAFVHDGSAVIGWLGDSRAYWIGAGGARQLTSDHSWINEVVSSGEMSTEEARQDSRAHAITRWLGGERRRTQSRIWSSSRFPGPACCCCAATGSGIMRREGRDGGTVERKQEMRSRSARGLVEFAMERGGQDNVTAAVLAVWRPEMANEFKAEVFQNQFLPAGASEVHAIMTVTAGEGTRPERGTAVRHPLRCLGVHGGRQDLWPRSGAMARLVSMLPEDCPFFIVAGCEQAHAGFAGVRAPPRRTRVRDSMAIQQSVRAVGGTAISTWLRAALAQFQTLPPGVAAGDAADRRTKRSRG